METPSDLKGSANVDPKTRSQKRRNFQKTKWHKHRKNQFPLRNVVGPHDTPVDVSLGKVKIEVEDLPDIVKSEITEEVGSQEGFTTAADDDFFLTFCQQQVENEEVSVNTETFLYAESSQSEVCDVVVEPIIKETNASTKVSEAETETVAECTGTAIVGCSNDRISMAIDTPGENHEHLPVDDVFIKQQQQIEDLLAENARLKSLLTKKNKEVGKLNKKLNKSYAANNGRRYRNTGVEMHNSNVSFD